MANKAAGEIEVSIDGKPYTLRPGYQAILDFEDRAGVSVFEAMKACADRQSIPLKTVANAYHACIKSAWKPSQGQPPSFEVIAAGVWRDGIASHVAPMMTLLGNMLAGERALSQAQADVDQGKV